MNPQDEEEKPICFVVMPISDVPGYDSRHFGRVYEHLFKPAIINAGYLPVRADDTNKTDYIVVSVIQKVVDSSIVLCDFSARNPNVMYELGIRHAFNRPVVLVKDIQTEKVFDIQGLRYTEYDSSLRIDTVQKDVSKITKALKETAKNQTDGYNSVVQLAGLSAAIVPEKQEISTDTKLLLSAFANLEKRVNSISENSISQNASSGMDKFYLPNGTLLSLGETIYDSSKNHAEVGILTHISNRAEWFIIRDGRGRFKIYETNTDIIMGFTTMPF